MVTFTVEKRLTWNIIVTVGGTLLRFVLVLHSGTGPHSLLKVLDLDFRLGVRTYLRRVNISPDRSRDLYKRLGPYPRVVSLRICTHTYP